VKYVAVVDGKEIEVEVHGERVTVMGEAHVASLGRIAGTPLRQLLLDGRPTTLSVEALGGGRWAITPLGERWEVEVLDERTRHIRSLTGNGGPALKASLLKAPMPGLVLRVQVTAGQAVAAGSGLVVLEAMKMENELKARVAAKVTTVRVKPGEAVEKGQVLVEFEEEKPA
jgi:biotin carboxyl carrier protein